MKFIILYLTLLLALTQVNGHQPKQCELVLKDFAAELQTLQKDFEAQDFDGVVAQTLIIQKIIYPVPEYCPTFLTNVPQFSFTVSECHSNIERLIQLFNTDIVSNFQEIYDIIQFQSNNCLPQDFSENGYETLFNFSNEEKSNPKICIGCNLYMTLLNNYISVYKVEDVKKFIEDKVPCTLFKIGLINKACDAWLGKIGPQLIEYLQAGQNSDEICANFNVCNGWTQCKLHGKSEQIQQFLDEETLDEEQQTNFADLVSNSLPSWLKKLIEKFAEKHLPVYDFDGDRFSTVPYLRGTDWRGNDCSPYNKNIYPGRKSSVGKKGADYNCNGIHGVDHETGVPFKHKFCDNTGQMGEITIGDSAGAHFSIPPAYFNVTMWTDTTFNDLLDRLMDEFDWPELSGGSGFLPEMKGNSFYLKMLERNRCNRNDYQNIGVNGARSRNEMTNMEALARNVDKDYPLMIFWELVGNDVCGSTPTSMTEPDVFRKDILELWKKLDTLVPKGSHMVVTGLVNGEFLYNCLKDREHPMGVTYPQFYEYLICMDSTPCAGWMNTDAQVRDNTLKRATELNNIQKEILENTKFENFDAQYYDFPMEKIMEIVTSKGGHCYDVIEPTDGFHPNELAEQLWADELWKNLERDHPDWLGKINPHNQEIIDRFGSNSKYLKINVDELDDIHIELQ